MDYLGKEEVLTDMDFQTICAQDDPFVFIKRNKSLTSTCEKWEQKQYLVFFYVVVECR